jgi:replicative DNA helicase
MNIPPQAVEVEEAILGAILVDSFKLDKALEHILPHHFYVNKNKAIYEAIIELHYESYNVDLLTVEQRLKDKGKMDEVGSVYLSDLTRQSAPNIVDYCLILKEKAYLRRIIHGLTKATELAYQNSDTNEILGIIDKATKEDESSSNLQELSEALQQSFAQISAIQDAGKPMGIRTGLDIDYITQGWQKGKLYFLGARPSQGKTALVLTCMRRMARDGVKNGLLTLETTNVSIANRLITMVSGVPIPRMLSGQMSKEEIQKVVYACKELNEYGIYLDDSSGVDIHKAEAKIRALVKQGCEVVFVDFLTLITNSGRNKHEEIGEITKMMKKLAKQLDVPIVVLAQLSRSIESRTNKRPMLSDLRESGSIEEDADVVMFLYRDEYYGITMDAMGNPTDNKAEVIIAKQKDGATGVKTLHFNKETMEFSNLQV